MLARPKNTEYLRVIAGPLQGSSSPALMRGFPSAVEPPVSHLGDDFGDLDSMLAGDAFIDKPDSRPPSRQPSRGPTDSASGSQCVPITHSTSNFDILCSAKDC